MSRSSDICDKVKYVVFSSTRFIEEMPLLGGESATPVYSASMVRYFLSLKDIFSDWLLRKATEDADLKILSDALKALAFTLQDIITVFGKEWKISDFIQAGSAAMDAKMIDLQEALMKEFPEKANVIEESLSKLVFGESIIDGRVLFNNTKDKVLSSSVTHLNFYGKGLPCVKHRLGVYCHEEDDYALCAVWPWAGLYEAGHSENWQKALIGAALERYPQLEVLILLLHDRDFQEWAGKVGANKVSNDDLNGDKSFKNTKGTVISIPFVVFSHGDVLSQDALKKDTVIDCFNVASSMLKMSQKLYHFKMADMNNMVSKAYDSALEKL